jgi:hypothetical protein
MPNVFRVLPNRDREGVGACADRFTDSEGPESRFQSYRKVVTGSIRAARREGK